MTSTFVPNPAREYPSGLDRRASRNQRDRRGLSLLELLVVVTFIGILAATAAPRVGRTLLSEFGARGAATQLSLALRQCQRAAISTGDDHYVEFLSTGKNASYRLVRAASGGSQVVDGPHLLAAEAAVTPSQSQLRFNFEGSALGAYSVTLQGSTRTWRIDVIPITGAQRVTHTP